MVPGDDWHLIHLIFGRRETRRPLVASSIYRPKIRNAILSRQASCNYAEPPWNGSASRWLIEKWRYPYSGNSSLQAVRCSAETAFFVRVAVTSRGEGTAMRIGGSFASPGGGLLLLFVIAVAGLATWLIFPGPSDAQNEAAASPSPAKVSAQAAFLVESKAAEPASVAPADTPAAVI
jgi:hypothetical protein